MVLSQAQGHLTILKLMFDYDKWMLWYDQPIYFLPNQWHGSTYAAEFTTSSCEMTVTLLASRVAFNRSFHPTCSQSFNFVRHEGQC